MFNNNKISKKTNKIFFKNRNYKIKIFYLNKIKLTYGFILLMLIYFLSSIYNILTNYSYGFKTT
jgi:hypothetical protein